LGCPRNRTEVLFHPSLSLAITCNHTHPVYGKIIIFPKYYFISFFFLVGLIILIGSSIILCRIINYPLSDYQFSFVGSLIILIGSSIILCRIINYPLSDHQLSLSKGNPINGYEKINIVAHILKNVITSVFVICFVFSVVTFFSIRGIVCSDTNLVPCEILTSNNNKSFFIIVLFLFLRKV